MKNLFRICLFLSVIFMPLFSHSLTIISDDDDEKINLDGSLADQSIRSVFSDPIQATINSSSLNVEFSNNLGIISVLVSSPSGSVIYDNNVNTQSQGTLSIDVSNWGSGVYQIRFVNSEGKFMYGTFEIE